MKTLKFEGYSDDTFIERTTGLDIDNCGSGDALQFDVKAPDGSGVRVSGCYGDILGDGCWMIGAEGLSEDKPVDWTIRLFPSHYGYRGRMEIDVPDDVTVAEFKRMEA